MKHCISAFTSCGCNYPSFVSINVLDKTQEIEITVRSEAQAEGRCGETACMKMSQADFQKLAREVFSFSCTSAA